MEQLVSNLLRETKYDDFTRVKEQKPAEIQEIEKSESLHSVLSISSGSSVEDPSSQQKRYRKPSQAFLYSQSIEEPKKGYVEKGKSTKIIHF
ncbi:unnamed protein product [Strongylus vulgaris]|uniref:Uncharacterized protein n=1 Tax=Strongylus vulgaris TaxID=40348 RepID=A0A3P7L6C9_STRVU|nr:unnamed protein product [Strongylus vulgaris]